MAKVIKRYQFYKRIGNKLSKRIQKILLFYFFYFIFLLVKKFLLFKILFRKLSLLKYVMHSIIDNI
ncbi:hypothetical protein EHP00_1174 [Ecytonucleospora hepatopenaei]|uniref:Uncharacterized protein n=1 Tax=Ecytonucleospora hepatopenaei TaxID=646526 RepID=A0A1W0E4D1_9MICR|nr:hypothetical protein EHP00_1174 [Ecytonucleospora hepatopenaei]